ncbi:unannotated protein [freshwater metagenome]|uniref:Unannotated protein n=1 Tax=freshwater metagenome TaxID=449393 RepID=A0A6J6GBT5_9ZZZZ
MTYLNVSRSFAYRSIAACSRRGSNDAIRAFTVTTTNEIQNITCAITTVQNPGLIRRFKNMASKDAPSTTSGVAIGRKIKRLVVFLPLNLCRPSANAIIVPKIVASTVEITPIWSELTTDSHTCGAPHGFFQLSKVKPCHTRLLLPASLNEKANV